jgi:predicted nucleotide-binding protein
VTNIPHSAIIDYRYDIFLSYSHQDKTKAIEITEALRVAGYKVFLDNDVIRPGESVRVAIERGMYASRAFIILIGEKLETSQNTFFELGLFSGLSRNIHTIIPIIIDDISINNIPFDIARYRLLKWNFSNQERSVNEIQQLLGDSIVRDEVSIERSEVQTTKATLELTFDIDHLSIEEQEQLLRTIEKILDVHDIKVEARRKGSEIYRISLEPDKAAILFFAVHSGKLDNFKFQKIEMIQQGSKVFIGHGRSPLWRELKEFLCERLKLECDEFNRESAAGISTTERLQKMLDSASFAFLIMTGEDEHMDNTSHARENVIHEVGLFQGRLGVRKTIILLEEGCNEFSNINGLGQIRFPSGRISAAYEEIRRVLEREDIILPFQG